MTTPNPNHQSLTSITEDWIDEVLHRTSASPALVAGWMVYALEHAQNVMGNEWTDDLLRRLASAIAYRIEEGNW